MEPYCRGIERDKTVFRGTRMNEDIFSRIKSIIEVGGPIYRINIRDRYKIMKENSLPPKEIHHTANRSRTAFFRSLF